MRAAAAAAMSSTAALLLPPLLLPAASAALLSGLTTGRKTVMDWSHTTLYASSIMNARSSAGLAPRNTLRVMYLQNCTGCRQQHKRSERVKILQAWSC
jgi:hypothetical protein